MVFVSTAKHPTKNDTVQSDIKWSNRDEIIQRIELFWFTNDIGLRLSFQRKC